MRRRQFAPRATSPATNFANRGRWFQRMLDAACTHYAAQRRAYIHPVAVPVHMERRRRGAFYERKSSTDYLGFLPQTTRPVSDSISPSGAIDVTVPPLGVAFDAKSTAGYEWGSGIPDHQMEILALVSELGHRAGILVGFLSQHGEPPAVIWVPWPAARHLAHGRWSQPKLAELPGARAVSWIGYPDFLPVLLNG